MANIYPIGNNSTLVIENVLTFDSGKYSCMAVNKAGSASSSVDIRVIGNKDSLSCTILFTSGLSSSS